MSADELAVTWLRDKAKGLRLAASASECAYRESAKFRDACNYVASAYRKAAALLDDAATELEDGATRSPGEGETP